MSVTQNVWDYIELSKLTKIPILLISNPGYGKTTGIVRWANTKGYHYEQLIGSRFSPDDIMGYQVNEPGKDTLVQKDPMWFQRIIDKSKDGVPTILFCDEISTCSDAVQGSLLSLIFDRRIGNGKELPEDCIILAAANYSENLPSFMNIMAPTINRFCIVNLLMGYNNGDLVRECLTQQNAATRKANDVDEEEIKKRYYEVMNALVMKYSHVDSTLGHIDLSNHDMANIYKRKGNVYNVMSWRSISYLQDLVIGMAKLGITDENVIKNVCAGMIGLGSNNFKTDDQVEQFISFVTKEIKGIVESSSTATMAQVEFKDSDKISAVITQFLSRLESTDYLVSASYENALVDFIIARYGDYQKTYENLKDDKIKFMEFISDMDSIALLIAKVNNENGARLANLHQSCSPMYNDLIGQSGDFSKEIYGIYTPTVIKRVILAKDKNGKIARVGTFGSTGQSYVAIPNGTNVADATLSRMITKDKFEALTLSKKI